METRGLDCSQNPGAGFFPLLDAIGSFENTYPQSRDMPDVEDTPIVPKVEHDREGSVSSIESSPGPDLDAELDGHPSAPASVQVQKRKGGRKPVCFS